MREFFLIVFTKSLKGVSRKFKCFFKEVSRVLQGRLKGVPMEFKVGFKGVYKKFEGCFQEV